MSQHRQTQDHRFQADLAEEAAWADRIAYAQQIDIDAAKRRRREKLDRDRRDRERREDHHG